MPAIRPDHFTVVTDCLEATRDFYQCFGFRIGPRPAMRVDGLWLYLGEHAVLHLLATDRMPEPRRGALDHMAFRATGLQETCTLLRERGMRYRLRRMAAPLDDWQLFFDDPNGVTVEFDFAGSEPGEPT